MRSAFFRTMVQTPPLPQNLNLITSTERDDRTHETAATIASFARITGGGGSSVTNPFTIGVHPVSAAAMRTGHDTLFSSIGFGIDSASAPVASSTGGARIQNDATEASVKAVRDALERGVLAFPTASKNFPNIYVHVKLGVPAAFVSSEGIPTPMAVDTRRLADLLPASIPILPIEVCIGGLATHSESGESSVCAAVACVSLQQQRAQRVTVSLPSMMAATEQLAQQQQNARLAAAAAAAAGAVSRAAAASTGMLAAPSTWAEVEASNNADPEIRPRPGRTKLSASSSSKKKSVHRSTSIDMLARISAELHDSKHRESSNVKSNQKEQEEEEEEEESGAAGANNFYNYRKLPPGVTPKNNKRLFVKHSYRDLSGELPRSDELHLVGSSKIAGSNNPDRTSNAAFPLMLHETLLRIERDGLDNIVGWLPHGRSFKIFQQKEFVDIILPRYFVMTKKSSFLRQLNLYGFNRMSGSGENQGSYYHEKFLRGMKFLCPRMHRQKVNGNGIRAAGNPDDEPNLSLFPPCPPFVRRRQPLPPPPPPSPPTPPPPKRPPVTSTEPPVVQSVTVPVGGARANTNPGPQVSFPLKLQCILDKLEADGNTDLISWLPHGRAFLVHDSHRFVNELMPVYFNQSKYSSFQRQLHMYNFQRITAPGRDKGAYHHTHFLRGRPELALQMRRTRVNGKGTRRPGDPENEPDFYEMDVVPIIPKGTVVDIPTDIMPGSKDHNSKDLVSLDDDGSNTEEEEEEEEEC